MRAKAIQEQGLRVRLVAASLAVVALLLVLPAAADAYLYWASLDKGAVGRAMTDGSGANEGFVTGGSVTTGVAVDSQHVYWVNSVAKTIGRANLDGSGANQALITGASELADVAVDGQFIYWTNFGEGTIGRANLDGSGVNPTFITGATQPRGIAVDGQFVYWAHLNSIGRANLDGSGKNQAFIPAAGMTSGLAVDPQHVYWGQSSGQVGRANRDGSAPNPNFITGSANVWGVAVDSRFVYWANITDKTIGRANLDGSGANQSFITGVNSPVALEVDSLPRGTTTTVSCSPSSLTLPATSTCTATVEDSGSFPPAPASIPPVGTISFAANSGSFTPAPSCGLVPSGPGRAACQVTFAPSGPGAVAIGGSYPGNLTHTASNSLTALTANAAAAPIAVVTKPPNKFKRAKSVMNLKKGIAIVPVTVPGPGKLVLTGKKLVFCAKQAKAAGKVNLLALPKKSLRERLKETGSAKAAFKVTFTPVGGEPRTENGSVTLRLRQQR
jgi:virginiamycin B lyase